jgi:hypothetical protein
MRQGTKITIGLIVLCAILLSIGIAGIVISQNKSTEIHTDRQSNLNKPPEYKEETNEMIKEKSTPHLIYGVIFTIAGILCVIGTAWYGLNNYYDGKESKSKYVQ